MPTRIPRGTRGRGRSAAGSPGQKLMSALGGAAAARGRRGGRRSTTTRGGGIAGLASSFLGRRR